MPRQPRIVAQGLYPHVVHRGINRQRIFIEEADKRHFIDRIAYATARHDVDVLAYCLMGNHYNLLFRDSHTELSRVMGILNSSYTTWFNLKNGRDGALLRGRFYSKPTSTRLEYAATYVCQPACHVRHSHASSLRPVRSCLDGYDREVFASGTSLHTSCSRSLTSVTKSVLRRPRGAHQNYSTRSC